MSFAEERQQMVERQLKARRITDPRVLAAMGDIPREKFVPKDRREEAYGDYPLNIGRGQTISQPYVVALTCQLLELTGSERVLDVGAGSGYQTAVLAHLAGEVIGVEINPKLTERACRVLNELGIKNAMVVRGDGKKGFPARAPYEAIASGAAARAIPEAWQEQLAEGGRIVTPVKTDFGQELIRLTKKDGKLVKENFGGVAFVPLV